MFFYNRFSAYFSRDPSDRWPIPEGVTKTIFWAEGMEASNDLLEEVPLESILQEQLPDNRLPSIPELLAALKNPRSAKPGLMDYLSRRPGLAAFLRECLS